MTSRPGTWQNSFAEQVFHKYALRRLAGAGLDSTEFDGRVYLKYPLRRPTARGGITAVVIVLTSQTDGDGGSDS